VLDADREGFGVTETWLTEDAIETFLKEYITSARLAYLHKKSPMSLARVLTRLKVKQYLPDQGPYSNHPIYAWKDIDAVGLAKILSETKNRKRTARKGRRDSARQNATAPTGRYSQ
jgi:hypothetical protein